MARFNILFALCVLILSVIAATPPSFCKCTCFSNSTIIPLSSNTASSSNLDKPSRAASTSCSICNKAFCLSQRLPICKDAEDKDVLTTCFQRDSRKDQIVVLTFIGTTVGLLGWAGVRKVLEKRKSGGTGGVNSQEGYIAVGR
ncbi:hypothetical protein BJ875DRAFT_377719 [Amylocarpus encephaloides]|uniref:Uncharacterized protein n=1 Tax=Amylocarpus encephaloides TaxID=45428 RepID=A0A9P7YI37_9HELO|nr:hypothetical protein BJ875DRAFT_377719 [Amylocarpus encephaloides]